MFSPVGIDDCVKFSAKPIAANPITTIRPVSAEKSSRLLIVDGHAYAYRAFHAIRQLNSPSGAPTNAIYGFIKMVSKMHTLLEPSHRIVVWDGGLAAERVAALPEYKVQRPPMPPALEQQMEGIVNYLRAANFVSFCREGVEADDWIATLTRYSVEAGLPVVIASSDKDFLQLVSPSVGLLNANDKSEKIWTANDVRAKTGVEPAQIIDWLSLIGDSVDNIAGVPGVGPRTAVDLLRQFGSVASLYTRLAEVKSCKLRASLETAAENVRRNQQLIRLRDDLPGLTPLDQLLVKEGDTVQLQELFSGWGFRSLLAQVSLPQPTQGELL